MNPIPFEGLIPRISFEAGVGVLGEIGKRVLFAALISRGAYSKDSDYLDSKILARNLEVLLGPAGAHLIMTQSYIRGNSKRSGTAAY